MPVSTRDEEIKEKRKDHSYLPYNLSARRAKMWTPSIWNALTFWRGGAASDDEGRKSHSKDAPHSAAKSPISVDTSGGANDISNGAARNESDEAHTHESSFSSNASEGQVSAQLTMERHVHFKLPSSEQQRSNSRTTPITPIQREARGNYHPPIPPSSSLHRVPSQNPLNQVAEYCFGRDHLNHIEALGLNSLIQQSVYVDGRPTAANFPVFNPFLAAVSGPASPSMSMSPSPPIPPTFTNPSTDVAALLASSATPPSLPHAHISAGESSPSRSSASPSRRLARNPNGPLYYQGGGSARPRYRSPAFSSSPARKKVAFPRGFGDSPQKFNTSPSIDSPSPSDGKRRRVGEERDSPTAQESGSGPATPNGIGIDKMPAPPTPKSLRFVVPSSGSHLLANTPARPSPLRQSVRADSSSPSSAGESPRGREGAIEEGPSRVTASEKASEIMAGIISNATPKKDTIPDVRNPYQVGNRSPTKRARKPTTKVLRPPPRPIRSTGSPSPPAAPQPKKFNAFETIQRTAPQAGSKRPHAGMPPPNARGTNGIHAPTPRLSAGKPIVIEISDDEEEEEQAEHPPAKKQRQEGVEIQKTTEDTLQLEDVDMNEQDAEKEEVVRPGEVVEPDTPEPQTQDDGKRSLFGGPFGKKGIPMARFQSVPKEPSPLRQSFQPDAPSSPPKDRSSPATLSLTTTTVSQEPHTLPSVATAPPAPFDLSAKPNSFLQASSSSFPQTSTSSSLASPPTPTPPQATFTPSVMPNAIVPTSTLATPSPPSPADPFASAKQKAINALPAALPTFVFALTSSTTVVSKTQREAALAAPVSEVPTYDFVASVMPTPPKNEIKPFDWSAAGMKPMVKAGWTCGTCFISNENNASKCISCESLR